MQVGFTANAQNQCVPQLLQDNNTFELVVAKAALDGSPVTPVLSLPMAGPATYDSADFQRHISAHAYAGELAIAVRTRHADPGRTALRVLRLDTSLL